MSLEVARTILSQIKSLDPSALMAWGFRDAVGSEDGVTFKVNGAKSGHAYVKITLNSSDLYEIEVFRIRRVKHDFKKTVLGEASGIYAEDLIVVLDPIIEGRYG